MDIVTGAVILDEKTIKEMEEKRLILALRMRVLKLKQKLVY